MFARSHSKTISVIIILLVLGGGFFLIKNHPVRTHTPNTLTESTPLVSGSVMADGQYCFARSQKATDKEPYSVEEHVVLNIHGTSITGTKSGTQAGPDMTNGYTGTLTGNKNDSTLTLVYAYTIEGSHNSESEAYIYQYSTLKKLRYPLVESQDVLIPDTSGTPTVISYTQEECPN